MPLGRGGMMLQGAWNFPVWKQGFPDFSYGVARPPAPAKHGYVTGSLVGNAYSVAVNAPEDHKAVAGDLFHFLGSQPGQELWARFDGSADPIWDQETLATLRKSGDLSEQDTKAFEIFDQMARIGPEPVIANPANEKVKLALKPVNPDLGSIVQGYLTGQIDNLKNALEDLDKRSEAALDTAIATAKKRGAAVSRDDWTFPQWDPSKDFGKADY
jgi:multiple sugar transport system substrate-binding protein